jgi:hypothetical protein
MRTHGPEAPVVMRRAPRFEDGPPKITLAEIRRTPLQALGQGLFAGAVGGAILLLVSGVALVVRWLAGGGTPAYTLTWAVFAFGVPLAAGAVAGLFVGTRVGVDVDDLGLRMRPAAHRPYAPWLEIVDIRTERRRTRTVVAVYLKEGPPVRLHAPYDGGALSHDPSFERKYFTLRNLWETHRSWRNTQ